MKKIKWGIVGPGIIANEFAHDIQFTKHAELVAVASTNRERGLAFAKKYSIPMIHSSYEDLYRNPEVDAIYVATPHVFHYDNSIGALNHGKAVLCEKPLTPNLIETKQLTEYAKVRGVYLMEGMWTYFLPAIQKAQEWIKDDKLGKILHVKSDFGYPVPFDAKSRMFNPDLAGGALLDMGCYTIAMASLFMPTEPESMHVISQKASTGVDYDVNMLFNYGEGTAQLNTSFRSKLHNWTFVIGEKGYIAIPDFWRAKECFLYEGELVVEHFEDTRKGFGFNFETDAVSLDILNGKTQSDIMPHATSLKLMNHMHKVMQQF